MTTAPEAWGSVPGYSGIYEVSTHGRIRSTSRVDGSGHTRVSRALNPQGSPYTGICLVKDGIRKRFLTHRLVLLTFVGDCPAGMQACHNDGNPLNNCVDNLRWDTLAANQADRRKHGTAFTRANHPLTKLRPADVKLVIQLRESGWTQQRIADRLSVSRRAIGFALREAC